MIANYANNYDKTDNDRCLKLNSTWWLKDRLGKQFKAQ